MNGRPPPVLFDMTSVLSMSCALDAAILVLVSLSLRPSTFGRRQLGILEWENLFTVERKWGMGSELGLSWTRTPLPASNIHLVVVVVSEQSSDVICQCPVADTGTEVSYSSSFVTCLGYQSFDFVTK